MVQRTPGQITLLRVVHLLCGNNFGLRKGASSPRDTALPVSSFGVRWGSAKLTTCVELCCSVTISLDGSVGRLLKDDVSAGVGSISFV